MLTPDDFSLMDRAIHVFKTTAIVRDPTRLVAPLANIEVRFEPDGMLVLYQGAIQRKFVGEDHLQAMFEFAYRLGMAGVKLPGHPAAYPTLSDGELTEIGQGYCPDCGGSLLWGPKGGSSQNVMCSLCRQEFNVAFVSDHAVMGHRNPTDDSPERMRLFSRERT